MDKKICVVRIKDGATVMIGGYRNGRLLVQQYQRYTGAQSNVIAKASEIISEYRGRGFIVAVDDIYGQLPSATLRTALAQKDENNAPRLVKALDAYRHLHSVKAINFSGCNRIDVSDTVIEPVIDGNGQASYVIDWEMFKEEQLALLLLCYHALNHFANDVSFLQQYFRHFNAIQKKGSATSVKGWRL